MDEHAGEKTPYWWRLTEADREKARAKQREYHRKNREAIAARDKVYKKKHAKKYLENNRRWSKTDKGKACQRKHDYGIDAAKFDQLRSQQEDRCPICRTAFVLLASDGNKCRIHVDHCHKTFRIRGLLCNSCNYMLGRCNDNVEVLKAAIKYLRNGGVVREELYVNRKRHLTRQARLKVRREVLKAAPVDIPPTAAPYAGEAPEKVVGVVMTIVDVKRSRARLSVAARIARGLPPTERLF